MKIKKINKIKISFLIITIVIIASIVIGVAVLLQFNAPQKNNTGEKSPEVNNIPNSTKETKIVDAPSSNKDEFKVKSNNSDSPDNPKFDKNSKKYQVRIHSSIDENDKTNITIRGLIDLSIQSGTCDIVLTGPNNKNIVKKTEVLMSPTTSSCETVSIPKNSLNKGLWRYKIKYESPEIIGESNEDTFEIK